MNRRSLLVRAGLVAVLCVPLAACGDDDDDDTADEGASETSSTVATTEETAPAASVNIAEPADGAQVTSPVVVKFAPTGFIIEPAGDGKVTAGHGHFHLIVDAECVAVGTVIPSDANHVHFGGGQLETSLNLTAGEHTLCLQAGDGSHNALDLTDEIKITVG